MSEREIVIGTAGLEPRSEKYAVAKARLATLSEHGASPGDSITVDDFMHGGRRGVVDSVCEETGYLLVRVKGAPYLVGVDQDHLHQSRIEKAVARALKDREGTRWRSRGRYG